MDQTPARRKFLGFLAGSPLLAAASLDSIVAGLVASNPRQVLAQSYDALRGAWVAPGDAGIITAPGQALNVLEFEPAAKKALLGAGAPAHYGYLASGVDGDVTRDANNSAYARYNIRVRRLIDARKIDTSVTLFGETWGSPIYLCPISSLAAFNPAAEGAVASAVGKRKIGSTAW